MAYNRLKIKLNELPIDGDSWQFDQNSDDRLKEHLAPEISTDKYDISVSVRPMGNIYEVSVNYQVSYELLCSKCAYDFKLPVSKSCREILMVQQKNERIDKQKSTSKNWQDDLFCTELESANFNIGEFLREIILIEAPSRPLGFGEKCEQEVCEPIKGGRFSAGDMGSWEKSQKNKPFSTLKDMLESKNKTNH